MHTFNQFIKENAFLRTPQSTGSFNQLREAMTKTPTLALPNFNKHFILETDASHVVEQHQRKKDDLSHT